MGQLSCGAAPAGERTEEQERETESRGPWERLGDGTGSAGGEREAVQEAQKVSGSGDSGASMSALQAGRGFFGVSSEQCGGWRWKAKGFRSVRGMRCVNRVRVAGGGDGVQSSLHQSMLRNSLRVKCGVQAPGSSGLDRALRFLLPRTLRGVCTFPQSKERGGETERRQHRVNNAPL